MNGAGWKRSLSLPATVRLVWHATEPHPREVLLDDFYARLDVPPGRDGLPGLIANMVMTQNGEATIDGKAAPIGTPVDRFILGRLRTSADALLYGAGTLLAEDVTAAVPEAEAARRVAAGRGPRLLVALLATDLAWGDDLLARRFFTDTGFDRLIITGPRATPEHVRRIEAFGVEVARVDEDRDGRPTACAALRALGVRGARLVLTEGGPRVLASLLRERLVVDYFLTTSPLATGDRHAPRPVGADVTTNGRPLLLSRVSRYEYGFSDPSTGAALIEAYDRFRVVYPSP
ncbi:MAG TPA: dihydrofolate reductase family protein [bacterium]|nr:dihydrofolate reductase family protein [bacterium]